MHRQTARRTPAGCPVPMPARSMQGSRRNALTVLTLLAIGPAGVLPAVAQVSRTLDTLNGRLIGTQAGDVSTFLGIPYASPPVGDLRFRPPVPHAPWSAPRSATAYGPACPQTATLGTPSTNEDCLTLDIFRPDHAGPDKPILVFLYGGSFRYGSAAPGSGSDGPNYDGRQIAERTGAVVVTVNYRLGLLGFLALPALDADDPRHVSGNYGLLDQQAALRWVRDNAGLIGGDRAHVTLFGQSAGALSIVEQMVSPEARGLFSATLLESVGALPAETLALAETRDAPILAATGCDTATDAAACLRGVPVATLLASTLTVGPVIDGAVLPLPPAQALAQGSFHHIPVAVMTDADEGTYFIADAASRKGHAVTAGEFSRTLVDQFGAQDAAAIAATYPASRYGTPGQTLSAVLTDEFFSCPAAAMRATLAGAVPTIQFEFAQPDPVLDYPVPAAPGIDTRDAHTTELAYLFGHDGAGDPLPAGVDRRLSDEMIDWLGWFAHSDRLLRSSVDQVVTLSTPPALSNSFGASHQCGFWTALGIKPSLIDSID